MRLALLLMLVPGVAAAWTFTPNPVCTLSHENGMAKVEITHHPDIPEYRMVLRLIEGEWAPSSTFGVAFKGGQALTIGTDRHQIEGGALSVADSGFGNVLNGLEFNRTATAFTSAQAVELSLKGAAPEVRRFRDCAQKPPALS